MSTDNSQTDVIKIVHKLQLNEYYVCAGVPRQTGAILDTAGKQILLGRQLPAISNSLSDKEKLAAILTTMRTHGLIATD
jgi:hypothetical protein